MEIRIRPKDIKIFVTRVSGHFQIYSEEEKKWTNRTVRASFKVGMPSLYDRILGETAKGKMRWGNNFWIVFEVADGKLYECSISAKDEEVAVITLKDGKDVKYEK